MILTGEKKLLSMKELRPIAVPNHPELAVTKLYQEFASRTVIAVYMPPKICKGRQLDKEYFWNIVNTVCPGEIQAMLEHANAQRNSV